ncbi:MAG: Mth938-like domain-containing protein [Betaproteobacteria bacterium]|nr:Mth938-like domain-containing protein [Betaproteobacteria bacterium]
MKFNLDDSGGRNAFTGYAQGCVFVNGARHATNMIVMPERILPWSAAGFEQLTPEDFEALARLPLEVVLLGTGSRLRFPHPRLTQPLAAARIGLEVMDLHAACRTYNILMAESRKVAAALLFD